MAASTSRRWVGALILALSAAMLFCFTVIRSKDAGGDRFLSSNGKLVLRVVHTATLDDYFNYYISLAGGSGVETHIGCLSNDDPSMAPSSVGWSGNRVVFVVRSGRRTEIEVDETTGLPRGPIDESFLTCPGYP